MLSGRAYGFHSRNRRGQVEPDRQELDVVALIIYLRERGAPLAAIAGRLNAQGKRTRAGHYWQVGQISRILKRAAEYRAAIAAQEGEDNEA